MSSTIITTSILILILLFLYYVPFLLWLATKSSGVEFGLIELILMRLRKVPPALIVKSLITAKEAGVSGVDKHILEAHFLAGGNITNVIQGLIAAKKAGLKLTVQKACKADLSGIDIVEAAETVAKKHHSGNE